MRHFWIRLVAGMIWFVVAVIGALRGDMAFAALDGVLGLVFLVSAVKAWKKGKD